jgi:hypothetical protein
VDVVDGIETALLVAHAIASGPRVQDADEPAASDGPQP